MEAFPVVLDTITSSAASNGKRGRLITREKLGSSRCRMMILALLLASERVGDVCVVMQAITKNEFFQFDAMGNLFVSIKHSI
jgi:hypothetical protein